MTTSQRLVWMDLIRGAAILLLLVWHASAVPGLYGVDMPDWLRTANEALTPFRMPVLMTLSGMLLGASLAKPANVFIAGKLRNIAWPYLIWVVLYFLARGGDLNLLDPRSWLATGHLWFLFYLLCFYGIALLTRRAPAWIVPTLALVSAAVPISGTVHQFAYFAVFFFIGHAAVVYRDRLAPARESTLVLVVSAVSAIAVAALSASTGLWYVTAWIPLVLLAIYAVTRLAQIAPTRGAVARLIAAVGADSIVYYTSHFILMAIATRILVAVGITEFWVISPVCFFGAVAVGGLLHRYRRTPAIAWLFQAPRFRRGRVRT